MPKASSYQPLHPGKIKNRTTYVLWCNEDFFAFELWKGKYIISWILIMLIVLSRYCLQSETFSLCNIQHLGLTWFKWKIEWMNEYFAHYTPSESEAFLLFSVYERERV